MSGVASPDVARGAEMVRAAMIHPMSCDVLPRPKRGGPRPGSGRKREGYLPRTRGDVAYARSLVHTLMKDEAQPMTLRARCALAVLRLGARTPNLGRKSNFGKR